MQSAVIQHEISLDFLSNVYNTFPRYTTRRPSATIHGNRFLLETRKVAGCQSFIITASQNTLQRVMWSGSLVRAALLTRLLDGEFDTKYKLCHQRRLVLIKLNVRPNYSIACDVLSFEPLLLLVIAVQLFCKNLEEARVRGFHCRYTGCTQEDLIKDTDHQLQLMRHRGHDVRWAMPQVGAPHSHLI